MKSREKDRKRRVTDTEEGEWWGQWEWEGTFHYRIKEMACKQESSDAQDYIEHNSRCECKHFIKQHQWLWLFGLTLICMTFTMTIVLKSCVCVTIPIHPYIYLHLSASRLHQNQRSIPHTILKLIYMQVFQVLVQEDGIIHNWKECWTVNQNRAIIANNIKSSCRCRLHYLL